MTNQDRDVYPVHLLGHLRNVMTDPVVARVIFNDEYVFATYLSTIIQAWDVADHEEAWELTIEQLKFSFPDANFMGLAEVVDTVITEQDRLIKVVTALSAQFSGQVTTTYVRDFLFSTWVHRRVTSSHGGTPSALLTAIGDILTACENRTTQVSILKVNLDTLQDLLDLGLDERHLIEVAILFTVNVRAGIFQNVLSGVVRATSRLHGVYASMISGYPAAGEAALSMNSLPMALGITAYNKKTNQFSPMSNFWIQTLTKVYQTPEDLWRQFVEPMTKNERSFSGAIARIKSSSDENLLDRWLTAVSDLDPVVLKINQEGDKDATDDTVIGNNVLVYGSSNLDKVGYLRDKLVGLDLDNVVWAAKVDGLKPSDVPSVVYTAQRILINLDPDLSNSAVLVVKRAEKALTKNINRSSIYYDIFGDDHASVDERELDSDELLLLDNPVVTIWVTDHVTELTPENIGRFLLHIELGGGSRKDRREEVLKICNQLNFSHEVAQELSMYYELNREQVQSAAKVINQLSETGPDGERLLKTLIANSQKALGRDRQEELRNTATKYDLGLLNIHGTMDPGRIIKALKHKPVGSLCFYGLPGTGKTALAEHIALQLDMPLLIKPASELLNMYLGETEKNIAKMFDEARSEGAILLLDEADSFLRDRSQANRSWEVTQVNELLQRMERFPGIFICTTNLFSAVDAAALRRFTFKLEFMALKPLQRLQMLANEAKLDLSAMSEADRSSLEIDLQLIQYLTPGDFAVVKRQADLLGEELGVTEWLQRLSVESKAKLVGIERNAYGQDPHATQSQPEPTFKAR